MTEDDLHQIKQIIADAINDLRGELLDEIQRLRDDIDNNLDD